MQNFGYLSFLLLANQNWHANEVLNMGIWWRQSMWVVLVPTTTHISSFVTAVHTDLYTFPPFLLTNQNKYANEVLNMGIGWGQTMWVVFVPTTTNIFTFFGWRVTDIHSSILPCLHTWAKTERQRKSKWSFKHSCQPTTKLTKEILCIRFKGREQPYHLISNSLN